MAGKQFFSILDARKGYHQVEIDPEHRHKMAFISHRRLYQFKRLPFGLKNTPSIFQRLMDEVVGSLRWNATLIYIDDLVIYSDTWTDHLMHLDTILQSARKFGLKFAVDKCCFGFHDIHLLGHGLSRYSLHMLDEKVRVITELQAPRSLGALYRACGMFGYYRSFIRRYSVIAKPLNDLKRRAMSPDRKGGLDAEGDGQLARTVKYNSKIDISRWWTPECQAAFDELKARLTSALILAYPRFDHRFYLYTDASADGFAGVLTQRWYYEDSPEDGNMSFMSVGGSSWQDTSAAARGEVEAHVEMFSVEDDFDWDRAYREDKV